MVCINVVYKINPFNILDQGQDISNGLTPSHKCDFIQRHIIPFKSLYRATSCLSKRSWLPEVQF